MKTGFKNSKDHDGRVAAAVSGGNEKISGRMSVACQQFGAWYDGSGTYGAAVNGHLPLTNSVNVLQGIKVDSYEPGWRYTGDSLRTQVAGYYSPPDKTSSLIKISLSVCLMINVVSTG